MLVKGIKTDIIESITSSASIALLFSLQKKKKIAISLWKYHVILDSFLLVPKWYKGPIS